MIIATFSALRDKQSLVSAITKISVNDVWRLVRTGKAVFVVSDDIKILGSVW